MTTETSVTAGTSPAGHQNRGWMLGVAILVALCAMWLSLEFAGERRTDVSVGNPSLAIPVRDDFSVVVNPDRQMLQDTSSNGDGPLYYVYPAVTYAQYLPLMFMSDGVLYFAVRILSGILVFLAILAWTGRAGLREHWIWPLLLSPPVINMIRLGQFNAAVTFAALTCATMAQRRERGVVFGASVAVALLARPTNALPVAAGLITAAALRQRRLLLPGIALPAVWFAALAVVASRWDPHWASHASQISGTFVLVGFPSLVRLWFGANAVGILLVAIASACAAVVWFRRAEPLSLDVVAGFFAVSLFATHLGGPYVGLFALPALARAVRQTGRVSIAWGAATAYMVLATAVTLGATAPILLDLFVLAPLLVVLAALGAASMVVRPAGVVDDC